MKKNYSGNKQDENIKTNKKKEKKYQKTIHWM